MKTTLKALTLAAALLGGAIPSHAAPGTFLAASDPAFQYQGRIDWREPAAPVIVWQSSSVSLDFDGAALSLRFGGARDQVFLDATVDGERRVIHLAKGDSMVTWPGTLGPGPHHLSLVKRTEAGAGRFAFLGAELATNAAHRRPLAAGLTRRFLFLGDSITAGACDEDGPADQWEDRGTHNAEFSYAAVASRALGADFENISVSGMGIVEGYVDVTVDQVWDRLYPVADSPKANLSAFVPDVVFLNFGQNDDSHSRLRKAPLPPSFVPAYLELLGEVRSAYPSAEIVLLRGGMHENTNDPLFIAAFDRLVSEARARDPRVSSFAFTHWTDTHPRVEDHRQMAVELSDWLRRQEFIVSR